VTADASTVPAGVNGRDACMWTAPTDRYPAATMVESAPRVRVAELHNGSEVDSSYQLKSCLLRQTPQGSPFLLGELQDASGVIGFVWWKAGDRELARLRSARYVRCNGKVAVHKDRLQLVTQNMTALSGEHCDPADYLPGGQVDSEALYRELLDLLDGIADPWIKAMLEAIFVADERIAQRFRQAPAAVNMHHAWLGGLLSHSLAVARLADDVAHRYPDDIDRSLLIAGALLHDLAKIDELDWDGAFAYSTAGNLVGHVVQGAVLLQQKADDIDGFPTRTLEKLQHLVLSHHGELNYGAAREPMLLEAVVLHHIDNIDARIEAFGAALRDSTSGDSEWTEFNRMFGRRLYKGE